MCEIGNDLGDGHDIGHTAIRTSEGIFDSPSTCREALDIHRPDFYEPSIQLASVGRGGRWADGASAIAAANTILPPNSPSCSIGKQLTSPGIYSAGSFHQGGTHVLMADGAVKFITESIDHGDATTAVVRLTEPNGATAVESAMADKEASSDSSSKTFYADPESPHGLWGALGTARGNETVAGDL